MKVIKVEEETYNNLLISIQDCDVTISEFIDMLLNNWHSAK